MGGGGGLLLGYRLRCLFLVKQFLKILMVEMQMHFLSSVSRSHSISQPVSQSFSHSVDQSINQLLNHLLYLNIFDSLQPFQTSRQFGKTQNSRAKIYFSNCHF